MIPFPERQQNEETEATENLIDQTVIPIVEERLDIHKREHATGIVSLQKRVEEYHETLDIPLASRTFDIERVILNLPVEFAPQIRHEGDTTIYPLVEEQLIITRQLILKEEVRVTRRDAQHRDTRTVTLRREHLDVTRASIAQPESVMAKPTSSNTE